MAADKDSGASKIYTKGGDKGKTSLIGGARVSKAHVRLEAYGTIDELNSVIGLLKADVASDLSALPTERDALLAELARVQNDLFDAGSLLACEDEKLRAQLPPLEPSRVSALERAMDEASLNLKPLKHFILPGGSRSSAVAHIARTVCRRAERLCVALGEAEPGTVEVDAIVVIYLNRLSDYLFIVARHLNRCMNIEEPIWVGKSK